MPGRSLGDMYGWAKMMKTVHAMPLPALVDMPVDIIVATGLKREEFAEGQPREGGMANLVVTADQIRPAD